MKKYLVLLLVFSMLLPMGCKKSDVTVWVASRDYGLGIPPWLQENSTEGWKQETIRFFKDNGVEILEIKTHREWWQGYDGPYLEREMIYCRIYREHLSTMKEYEFKLISD